MKFSAWIDYPTFSIAIQIDNGSFRCVKFVDNKMVRGAEKTFDTLPSFEEFLTSLPYPPKEQISEVLDNLHGDLEVPH